MPDAADRDALDADKWDKADRDALDADKWVKVDRAEDLQVARDKDVGAVRWVREDNEVVMDKADRDVDRWDKADKVDKADRAEVLQAGKAAVIPQTA